MEHHHPKDSHLKCYSKTLLLSFYLWTRSYKQDCPLSSYRELFIVKEEVSEVLRGCELQSSENGSSKTKWVMLNILKSTNKLLVGC
jgi:hypothetical protein